jgi:uncharacterized protein YjiS (DUF1127 family)
MLQIKSPLRVTNPLTYCLDPIGASAGCAVSRTEMSDRRLAEPHNRPQVAFVPSCPFRWSPPTLEVVAPGTDPADASPDAPGSQGRSRSWFTRLWARYGAWRERRRAAAAWEELDSRVLRDIGVLPDESDPDARSTAYWNWYSVF